MSRFYRIQIGDIYLTKTGLVGGTPAKLQVSGVDDLFTTVIGIAIPAVSGAVLQLVPWTTGKTFEINIETYLTAAVWQDLIDLINDSLENDTALTIIGTGDTGNFNVEAKPFPVKPFSSSNFENGRILKPIFKFITV